MKVRVGQDDANCVLSLLLLDHTFPSEQVKLLHPRLEDGGDGVVDMISRMLRKRRVDAPSRQLLGRLLVQSALDDHAVVDHLLARDEVQIVVHGFTVCAYR